MKDELRRNLYIQTLSEKYGIYESVLFRELEQLLKEERTARRRGPSTDPRRLSPRLHMKPRLTLPRWFRHLSVTCSK